MVKYLFNAIVVNKGRALRNTMPREAIIIYVVRVKVVYQSVDKYLKRGVIISSLRTF